MQLTVSGETCGWAPPENSRNNSAKNVPEIPRPLESIFDKILQILKGYSQSVNHNGIQISHNGSIIISITTDQQPKIFLIPENNLEFNYKTFENDCYKFINNETGIEIWICNSGEIIFKQKETNIEKSFTPQTISQLLNIQLFYFTFSEIYELLHERFFQNRYWNNTLKITELGDNLKYCLFEFEDINKGLVFKLQITYDPIEKQYKYFVILLGSYRQDTWELLKDKRNPNEYITNIQFYHEYKINLEKNQIFKINTSVNINHKGIFELKWSQKRYYHWENIDEKQQSQQPQQLHQSGNNSANFSNISRSIEKIINNSQSENSLSSFDKILKILKQYYPETKKLLTSTKLILSSQNSPVLSLTSKLVLSILSDQPVDFNYRVFENGYYKFKNTDTNDEIWIDINGDIIYSEDGEQITQLFNKENILKLLELYPPPLIQIGNSTFTQSQLVKKLNKSESSLLLKLKNGTIEIEPNILNKLFEELVRSKVPLSSKIRNLFKTNKNGQLYIDLSISDKNYRITYNTSKKLIEMNSKNSRKQHNNAINVTNQQQQLQMQQHPQQQLQQLQAPISQPQLKSKFDNLQLTNIRIPKKYEDLLKNILVLESKSEQTQLVPVSKKESSKYPQISEIYLEFLKRVQELSELTKYKINIPPINISNNLSIVPYEGTALAIFKDNSDNLFPFPLIYDHNTEQYYFKILVNKKEYKLIVKKEGDNHIFELKNKSGRNVSIIRTSNIKNINKNQEIAVEINNSIKKTSNPSINLKSPLNLISLRSKKDLESIVPNFQNQLKKIKSQIPVNPQESLQNT